MQLALDEVQMQQLKSVTVLEKYILANLKGS